MAFQGGHAYHPLQSAKRSWGDVLFVVDRNEKSFSIDPAAPVASALESLTAATTASALADSNLEDVSNRQLREFDDDGFSGTTSSAVASVCDNAVVGLVECCSFAAVTSAKVASPTVVAVQGLPITGDRTAATATATIPAGGNVQPLSELQGGSCSTSTAATAGGTVKVKTLHAEGAATAATTTGRARYHGNATCGGPWPHKGAALGNPSEACFHHVVAPDVSPWSRGPETTNPEPMWLNVIDET